MDFKYPYTDFHELNLDWFMAQFKTLTENWAQVQSDWTDLHDYVQNYFDNLNVQTEIDNKIDAMILNGTFADIVSPFVTAALPALVAGQLPDVVAAQISAVVAAQISAVVADQLPTVAAAAAAQEVGTWLAAHIDPDTGYVIDDTLTVSQAAADAKTVGDNITTISSMIGRGLGRTTLGAGSAIYFTDIRPGDIVYWNIDVPNTADACYGEALDIDDQRIGDMFGKYTNQGYTGTHFEGSIVIPAGTVKVKIGSTGPANINYFGCYDLNDVLTYNLQNVIEGFTKYTNLIPGYFYSYNADNEVTSTANADADCTSVDVSRYNGKYIYITTTQVKRTIRLMYEFVDQDNIVIDSYMGFDLTTMREFNNEKVLVPDGAARLYVNVKHGKPFNVTIYDSEADKIYGHSKLWHKSIVTYGDSLTWYDGKRFTWGPHEDEMCVGFQTYLRSLFDTTVTNKGVSGYDTPEIYSKIINDTIDLTTYDYVMIMGGDNDSRGGTVGSLAPAGSTFDTTTVYGALQASIEYILGINPAIKIILMTEPVGWNYIDGSMQRVSEDIPNAYRNVAAYYGLQLIDNWKRSGINELTRTTYYCDPADNTQFFYHPNNAGWKRIATHIIDELVTQ